MDTYVHPRIWGFDRADFIEPKNILMERSRVLAEGGRDSLMVQMLESYKIGEKRALLSDE
jgi:hypothetical protein